MIEFRHTSKIRKLMMEQVCYRPFKQMRREKFPWLKETLNEG
ncbi:hypothetical protein [Gottfriedia endophytica]|nr:hypothetical protein [Gottfriedia endophytica]